MAMDTAWNMYVFRDGKVNVRSAKLVEELQEALERVSGSSPTDNRTELMDALLRAGERR